MTESEICLMLQDFAVFFSGDFSARRQAIQLQSLLGGLSAANARDPSSHLQSEQLIPDAFGVSSTCIPSMRCPGVFIGGTVSAKGSWEAFMRPPYISVEDGAVELDAPSATEYYRFAKSTSVPHNCILDPKYYTL